MVEQQSYIPSVLSPTDVLSEDVLAEDAAPGLSDCARSSISSYADLTPYSAVSSFPLSTHCEPDLLTPISTADSPPLEPGHNLMGKYPPPDSPNGQGPTPPGSSKMYHHWSATPFEMNSHPSETSSPMPTPGHAPSDFYVRDRRTPVPPEPYMGNYGVSDPAHQAPISQSGSPYYLDQLSNQNSLLLRSHHPLPMEPHCRELNRDISLAAPAPLLQNVPRASPYPQPDSRRASHDVMIKTERNTSEGAGSPSGFPRKLSGTIGNNRVRKAGSKKKSKQSSPPEVADDHKNCNGEEVPPSLKDSCPPEERCIFDSRWRHRNKRGQDMWDSIQKDFYDEFKKSSGKEMLQMKFKRARSKYIQWMDRDEEILQAAWKRVEQQRYQIILDTFLEMGGSRNMRLNSGDIEVKLVNDLKLEEHLYMDYFREIDVRRRRKLSSKKRAGSSRKGTDDLPMADSIMCLSPHVSHNEDDVISQVHEPKSSRWDASPAGHDQIMDMQLWDSRVSMKLEPGSEPHRMFNGTY
ncbi:hypothetical protein QQS21_000151 [Conoideocrella luteorostrata]|uniref:Uncharacterized protein n=1 Tax=Conoideocrella luteorostrata TaxID=1105319 RepID=A0AAJ0CZR9_9HYPO|nr:hypothetical protein QQS21_000151 [Conoideocrella luteorostrata]